MRCTKRGTVGEARCFPYFFNDGTPRLTLVHGVGGCYGGGTIVLRGTIVNGTYLWYTSKPMYLTIFTDNIWSYLLWSPVIALKRSEAPRLRSYPQPTRKDSLRKSEEAQPRGTIYISDKSSADHRFPQHDL